MLLHLSTWPRDRHSRELAKPTYWHQLIPPTRILCSFLLVFAVALNPNGKWLTWVIYGVTIAIVIYLSKVIFISLLKRVIVEFVFVGMILLGTLFREGGIVLWSWGWLQITTDGLTVLASIALKVFLSLLMLNLLIITTPIADILQGLLALKMPPLLVAIMASMYRYINVLQREFLTMQRAAKSRNLMLNKHTTRLVIGNIIGTLFIRTYDRGERIYQAMLARGYQGLPTANKIIPYKNRDILALAITVSIISLGQIVNLMKI
jgi:cobalt/nickel transport system permease protein